MDKKVFLSKSVFVLFSCFGIKKLLFYWEKGFHYDGSCHVFPLPLHVFFLESYFEDPNEKLLLRPE
jgi:hypothetical protein